MGNFVNVPESEEVSSGFKVRNIFYLAGILLVILSIVSYTPADGYAITGGVDAPPANWIGNLGAFIGYWMFNLFGLAAYVLVALTVLRVVRLLLPGSGRPLLFLSGELSFMIGVMLLLGLSPQTFVFFTDRLNIGRIGMPELALSGGVIGQVLAAPGVESLKLSEGVLRNLIGAVGTTILSWALILSGTIMIYFSDWHHFMQSLFYRPMAERRAEKAAAAASVPDEEYPKEGGLFSHVRNHFGGGASKVEDDQADAAPLVVVEDPPAVKPMVVVSEDPNDFLVDGKVSPLPDLSNGRTERPAAKPAVVVAEEEELPLSKTAAAVPVIHNVGLDRNISVKGVNAANVASTREFTLPPLSMLSKGEEVVSEDPASIVKSREILQRTLDSFGVPGTVSSYISGPRITRYEITLAEGVKVKKVEELSDNIAMNLSAKSVRVLAPIPGRPVVGVEIPNSRAASVFMRSVMESDLWRNGHAEIPIVLGKDVAGSPVILDLARAPHLLIAGATGSGKSVCMNTLIMSLLFKFSHHDLRLIMVDPKVVEFEDYKRLPHLITPVINDSRKVPIALRWAVNEMDKRYMILAKAGVKKLSEYNKRHLPEAPVLDGDGMPLPDKMPILVVIIDELADLMMTEAKKDAENSITRIAQKGRAAGVHIVVATQRPSTNVITGIIKANLPTRIAFRVGQMVDSRVILDNNGAEKLLGYGDMLYLPPGGSDLERVQGALVNDDDIKNVVKFVSDQAPQSFNSQVVAEETESAAEEIDPNLIDYDDDDYVDIAPIVKKYLQPGDDEVVKRALEVIVLDRRASTSYIQRRLKIGYNRAAEIMDLLESRNIVGPPSGSGNKRDILIFDEITGE